MREPPNRPNLARAFAVPGFMGADSMPVIQAELRPTPSLVPIKRPSVDDMTDDECLARLARTVEEPDSGHLDEVAQLIARLAVTIE
jgi:hypothetical protein